MGKKTEKKDNRGMSLVEIIIVIALMSVVAGMAAYGLGMISNKPVDECAKKVEFALNRNRTTSMGKLDTWLEFYMEDGRLMARECFNNTSDPAQVQVMEPTVIGAEGVYMSIQYDTGTPYIVNDEVLRVAFERDSGAVKAYAIKDGGSALKCKEIKIYRGSYVKTITLDLLTGRVKVD